MVKANNIRNGGNGDRSKRRKVHSLEVTNAVKNSIGNVGSGSDLLSLNVNGTITKVLRRTLCAVEGSMLASQFSGRWDEGVPKDSNGNYYIAQPYHLFMKLIEYLIHKSNETPNSPPARAPYFDEPEDNEDLYRMICYYGMEENVFPVKLFQSNETNNCCFRTNPYGKKCSDEHIFYTLIPCNPSMAIKSFECVLHDVTQTNILLRWALTSESEEVDVEKLTEPNPSRSRLLITRDIGICTGYCTSNKCLEWRDVKLEQGKPNRVRFDNQSSNVYFNDRQISSASARQEPWNDWYKYSPRIWCDTGSMTLTNIEVVPVPGSAESEN